MKISKFTILFGIYIIASSYFMQDVWTIWRTTFGIRLLNFLLIFLCLAAVSAILYKNIKSGFNIKKSVLISAICIWGFIFAWRQPYFPEKAHVLEFALLGWLAMKDLTKQTSRISKKVFIAFLFVAIIGCLEEGFQKILPWRVCEARDIITDILSGILGIFLFLINKKK